mgnify:CR=1 FL=1
MASTRESAAGEELVKQDLITREELEKAGVEFRTTSDTERA